MTPWIEGAALAVMVVGLVGLLVERAITKRGLGVRTIQLATILLVLPSVLILAIEHILEPQTVGVLFGTIVGYVLSGIGKSE